MAKTPNNPKLKIALLREKLRRDVLASPRATLRKGLFAQQQKFFDDRSPSKVALCSRRAGKSHTCCMELLAAALTHQKSVATYLALTRQSAKEIMWATILQQLDLMQIPYDKHENELSITLKNYSVIRLLGADHKRVIETLRGARRSVVVIDEFGSFSPLLQQLVEDSIEPSLVDLSGQVVFVGTPPPARTEYFETLVQRHKLYHWTLLDNPHIPHARNWLELQKVRKNWTEDNATYRREYLGMIVDDPDALVYRVKPYTVIQKLPEVSHWEYLIGIDYGWHDACAVAVVAYSPSHPSAYIVESSAWSKIIPSEFASEISKLATKYNTNHMVADTGGLGKAITEEFRVRYGLPIKPAQKTEKMATISMMNGDLEEKRLFILESCAPLLQQMKYLQWDEDRKKEKQGMPNDRCDAALYAYRASRHYWYEDVDETPWIIREENDMASRILERYLSLRGLEDE